MKISIHSVPQYRIRAEQAGDWRLFGDDIIVYVLETLSLQDQIRVGVHELIEAFLCKGRVSDEAVCSFDEQYEAERKEGKHKEDDEPGDDPRSPYRDEHQAATHVERATCHVLNIPWELNLKAPLPPAPESEAGHQKT